jgi:predicted signal transduction protein with EAL and GGDEF domain
VRRLPDCPTYPPDTSARRAVDGANLRHRNPSSLRHLQGWRVDTLKIDPSFVNSLMMSIGANVH